MPYIKTSIAETGDFTDALCCSDTQPSTNLLFRSQDRTSPTSKRSSILTMYRESYASVSATITTSDSFSSLIDYEDDAKLLERARKDVTIMSPVMLKYTRSSSLKIHDHHHSTVTSISRTTISPTTKQRRHVSGPSCGTFENAFHDHSSVELDKTYMRYRMYEDVAELVMTQVHCTLPVFHTKQIGHRSNPIIDTCSEPLATNFHVRGENYLEDGLKFPSDEALFALLGCDSIMRDKSIPEESKIHVSSSPDSYVSRFRKVCHQLHLQPPFILVINFVVPWGNLLSYYYRPDGLCDGRPFPDDEDDFSPSDRLLKKFLTHDDTNYRNSVLKFIPSLSIGPWILKRVVGSAPALIGQKLPTSYYGSLDDGYLEICLDITKGSSMVNSICSSVASKSSAVTVDLAFLLEGTDKSALPEQLLSTVRLHHISLIL